LSLTHCNPNFPRNTYRIVSNSKTIRDTLKVVYLSKKAFEKLKPTSKHRRETLAYAFEQLKPILKEYMKENHILALEIDLKTKHALALEPIHNGEREAWLEMWLNNDVSTEKLEKRMRLRFQWCEYLSFADFLEGVELWLRR